MKRRQLWLFRICLILALFVASNRIFAWTESTPKYKTTLQILNDSDEEEDDVCLPPVTKTWEFKTRPVFPAILAISTKPNQLIPSHPLFLRFCNLRL